MIENVQLQREKKQKVEIRTELDKSRNLYNLNDSKYSSAAV